MGKANGKCVNTAIPSVELTGNFAGDGACDKFGFREVLGSDILQIIPPPKNAVIQEGSKKTPLPDYPIQRNRAVEEINRHGSRRWKEENGYHRRSLNEVAMFRYKTIFGGELDARTSIIQPATVANIHGSI